MGFGLNMDCLALTESKEATPSLLFLGQVSVISADRTSDPTIAMKLLCLAWLALCLADDAQNLRGNGKAVTVAPIAAKPEEVGCGWMVESKDGLIMFYQQLWTWCYQQTCCNTHTHLTICGSPGTSFE